MEDVGLQEGISNCRPQGTVQPMQELTYLTCVGDSVYELEAANSLAWEEQDRLIKTTIKFREKPQP